MDKTAQENTEAVETKVVSSEEEAASLLFTDEGKKAEASTEEAKSEAETKGTSEAEVTDEKKTETDESKKDEGLKLEVTADSGLSDKDVESMKEFAKANNLSQEAAQKLLDDKANLIKEVHAKQQSELKQKTKVWLEESKTDSEIGGDKLNISVAHAKNALEAFGTPALIKMLNDSGLGNNREVLKTFARIGQKMSNGTMVAADKSGSAPTKSLEDIFYPVK